MQTQENTGQPRTYPTQSGKRVSQGLRGVRQAARDRKQVRFTALLHHLTVDLLATYEALWALVDDLTAANLALLHSAPPRARPAPR